MKYKTIWTKIKDLKHVKLNALPAYDDTYIKPKIRKCGDKVHTNYCGLNLPEDDLGCESFTGITIDSLLVYEIKYYLQVYLHNRAYKIANKKMTDYHDESLFED